MDKILLYTTKDEIKRKIVYELSRDYNIIDTYFDEFSYLNQINTHKPDCIIVSSSDVSFITLSRLVSLDKLVILILDSNFNISGLNELDNFAYLDKNKMEYISDFVRLLIKDFKTIKRLKEKIEVLKEKEEEERLVKKAKLFLMKKGMSENEAYKYIIDQSMKKRMTKKSISLSILNE